MGSMTQILAMARAPAKRVRAVFQESITVQGACVWFTSQGQAALEPCARSWPGRTEVLVEAMLSLVSPGTERASYLDLPNALGCFPRTPGYCLLGKVLAAGQASRLRLGERVIASVPHASFTVQPAAQLFLVPAELPAERAVFAPIGAIALQGLRKARLEPGESVAVLGAGLIGQLALRLAMIAGAYPVIAIARSLPRLEAALRGGAHRVIATAQDAEALDEVQADVVLDVTGVPEAIRSAIRAVRPGGRVVLVGSNRGVTQDGDLLASLHRKGVTLIGAHVAVNPQQATVPGYWPMPAEWRAVLDLIADGRLQVDDLITGDIQPPDVPELYRQLAQLGDDSLGVLIRWDTPGPWTPQRRSKALAERFRELFVQQSPAVAKASGNAGTPVRLPGGAVR